MTIELLTAIWCGWSFITSGATLIYMVRTNKSDRFSVAGALSGFCVSWGVRITIFGRVWGWW